MTHSHTSQCDFTLPAFFRRCLAAPRALGARERGNNCPTARNFEQQTKEREAEKEKENTDKERVRNRNREK